MNQLIAKFVADIYLTAGSAGIIVPNLFRVRIVIRYIFMCMIKIQLTETKKMADIQFIRMHCGQKSFKKANGRLLKDRHKAGRLISS